MIIRAIGILALTLAAGCAFEQSDPTVEAPGAAKANTGSGVVNAGGGAPQTPTLQQSNQAPVTGGDNGHGVVPSTEADPCDPDPQPWQGNCPRGPDGNSVKREPLWLTPKQ
jgi:hypothetical protein